MRSYREVTDHLTRAHPSLSPQVRKAAAYVLENPGDVATLSMRKVAAAASVPPPTLPRLAEALGFETYNAFREVYRRQLLEQSSGYSEQAGRLQQQQIGDGSAALWSAFRQSSLANIEHLYDTLGSELIGEVAAVLLKARKVFVAGMQASAAFADYFQYVGCMAHSNWVLVQNRNGVLADWVVDLDQDDALIAIALDPCARDTIRLAQMAQARGAVVIGITNSRATPLAARSDFALIVPSRSPQFFESYVSTTALLEALIGFVVAKSSEDVVQNIDRVELCRRRLGEYWDRGGPNDETGS